MWITDGPITPVIIVAEVCLLYVHVHLRVISSIKTYMVREITNKNN